MRVFKNKWFNRWARGEVVSDSVLLKAAMEILSGKVEADLGGYLFKKRLAQAGRGKRGGYRTIVGYREDQILNELSFFMLLGRVKRQIFLRRKRPP